MVEGHGCHRVGHFHRQKLLNRSFKATSPNGRFIEGAAAINNQPLTRIEVHGKNLFYFFGSDANPTVLHFHFGMAGAFSVHSPPQEPKPTTRLRLENKEEGIIAHLSAMIVQHGDLDFYNSKISTLGEDPLRDDANADVVWSKISSSKKPIGLLLMDQSVVAGIGNIYRAEILFKAGVHPEQPGYTISKPAFDLIWKHSVELLQRGFQTGSILTVDPEEAEVLGQPWTRRYIYNHSECGRCGNRILSWDMASRTVYCCTTCQPLQSSDAGGIRTPKKQNKKKNDTTASTAEDDLLSILPAARVKAMAAARQAIQFVSHCAPDDVNDADTQLPKLTVAALRARAEAAGFSSADIKNKKKGDLVSLLEKFDQENTNTQDKKKSNVKEEEKDDDILIKTPLPGNKKRKNIEASSPSPSPPAVVEVVGKGEESKKKVKPGTAGLLGKVASAREAALEKVRAGEGRNVEHVALHDDEEAEIILKTNRRR